MVCFDPELSLNDRVWWGGVGWVSQVTQLGDINGLHINGLGSVWSKTEYFAS